MQKLKIAPVIIPIILILLFFMSKSLFVTVAQATEQISSYLLYPVLIAQRSLVEPVGNVFKKRKTEKELELLLQEKQQELEDARAQTYELRALLDYTHDTKELISFKQRYMHEKAFLAQVLVKHIAHDQHVLLLDKGANHGVTKDMVAVYKNCLVGKVIEVRPWYSRVALVTDRRCKVGVYCAGTESSGIHEGLNASDYTKVNYVSHLCPVKQGNLILSSGEGLLFPRGFTLGTISSSSLDGLYHAIAVKPSIDPERINYCYLLRKGA